ncbi:MAG: TIGR01244 family sulfur transferase [Pseudomonadales bacterium]|nr:TIGR01244 family sulfur transferase [Pseudomonadales bacterium]
MLKPAKLSDIFSSNMQIAVSDLKEVKALGFKTVINNRPDHEADDQPSNAEFSEMAAKLGLEYHFIPINLNTISEAEINAMQSALDNAAAPVFSFCRTGNRCTILWSIISIRRDIEQSHKYLELAANAGFDMYKQLPLIRRFISGI